MNDQYRIDGEKISRHPLRVAQWLNAGDDWEKASKIYPIYCEISPNGGCNHRCAFCAVDYIGYQSRKLDTKVLKTCLRDMAYRGVKSVMFAGEGEPLLHPDIGELCGYAKLRLLDVAITTNATQRSLLGCLPHCTWIKASINAGTPDVYAAVHQTKKDDFARAINNLSSAVTIRRACKLPVTLGAQMVLLPENWLTAGELARRCRDIGLDYLVIKPYSQQPASPVTAERYGNMKYDSFIKEDLADYLATFNTDSFKVVYRSRTMANLAEPERAYKTCLSTPVFWAYIMASGDVYGCGAHLLDERFRFGNINEQSFSEIWEGERRRQCLEMMRAFDIGECRKACRMEECNKFLWEVKHPGAHANFI